MTALERVHRATGNGDQRAGYGVMALTFQSGHTLSLWRSAPATAARPRTAVWHRNPNGQWICYADGGSDRTPTDLVTPAMHETICTEIRLEWFRHDTMWLTIARERVAWAVRVVTTAETRAFNCLASIASALPRSSRLELRRSAARRLFGDDPAPLHGHAAELEPRRAWFVVASAAVVDGRDLGPVGSPQNPQLVREARGAALARRGVFLIGNAKFTTETA